MSSGRMEADCWLWDGASNNRTVQEVKSFHVCVAVQSAPTQPLAAGLAAFKCRGAEGSNPARSTGAGCRRERCQECPDLHSSSLGRLEK